MSKKSLSSWLPVGSVILPRQIMCGAAPLQVLTDALANVAHMKDDDVRDILSNRDPSLHMDVVNYLRTAEVVDPVDVRRVWRTAMVLPEAIREALKSPKPHFQDFGSTVEMMAATKGAARNAA